VAGDLLKKRREELRLDLKDISDRLRIKMDYLSSIEDDRFDKLPVAVYTIGYIRCYASHLGIDPEPIIDLYTGRLSKPEPATIMPIATSRKKIPLYYYVAPVLLLLLAGAAIFFFTRDKSVQQRVSVPAAVQSPRSGPQMSAPTAQSAEEAEKPVHQPQPVDGEHTLGITADDLTWMHIRFSNGKYEEALLRPGMTKEWTFTGRAALKLGNAGGVRLNLDGKDMGAPGSLGQVITLAVPEGPLPAGQGE
jgi:cytoskeleton protein RodZ